MKLLLSFLLAFNIFALPKKVEVIFLSEQKVSSTHENLIKDRYPAQISKKVQADPKCRPMGDGCFHPQHGYIEGKSKKDFIETEKKDVKLKTINSMDTNMIDCKKGNYFDIFCGKASANKHGPVNFEIWVDTSSSMRRFDYSKDIQHCKRRSFIERLKKSCSLNVKTFDTSIKNLGGLSNLCLNYGLNDQKRIIKWIENSNAKHLIIVTDIDEASQAMRDYLFKIGADLKGADTGDYTSDKLVTYVDSLSKSCQKPKK